MAETIKSIHADIVICKGVVHDLVSHYLQSFGILCLENVSQELCQFTCKTLNIQYVQSIEELQNECSMMDVTLLDNENNSISQNYLGLVESCEFFRMNGGLSHHQVLSTLIKSFRNTLNGKQHDKPTTCTTIIRGSTIEQCEEFVRHAQDALYTCMVTLTECSSNKSSQSNTVTHDQLSATQRIFVTGGGSIELYCMWQLEQKLLLEKQRQQFLEVAGIESFIKALRVIPETLCMNAGLQPEQTIRNAIRKQKDSQCSHFGIPARQVLDMDQFEALLGDPSVFHQDNMLQMEIYDSIFTKRAMFETSIEIAKNILVGEFCHLCFHASLKY